MKFYKEKSYVQTCPPFISRELLSKVQAKVVLGRRLNLAWMFRLELTRLFGTK